MQQLKPLQLKAYEFMKEQIQEDALKAGVIYSETKMAAQIGISRTPFRDAIHRLMQEGYIDILPSKGFMLHELNEEDVIETYQIRTAIEGYCAREAARTCDSAKAGALFERLEELIGKQEACAKAGDIKQFVIHDHEFHRELVAYINNPTFNEIFGMHIYRIKRLAAKTLAYEGRVEETLREHKNIVAAMRNGDCQKVDQVLNIHMDRPQELILNNSKLWES